MPVEPKTSTTIEELDESWPLGTDPIARGDDHIRLLKRILKTQFIGAAGSGFAKPITATEDELNHLAGVNSNIQQQIDDLTAASTLSQTTLYAPKGTKLVFHSSSVPTGWKIDTALHDKFLRVVNDATGGNNFQSGGTSYSQTHTHTGGSVTLTEAQIPSHDHISNAIVSAQSMDGLKYENPNTYGTWTGRLTWEHHKVNGNDFIPHTSKTGGGQPHSHTISTTTTSWSPSCTNVVVGIKE